ncbi:hypothetical protein CLRAG_13440 [Clostridium ragsdalei P11]|uniref:Uncharacterized protein n=1 Tax=Clostridium ragsdalei P11 TaxID=1353534 RepID=A0A1A6AY47_9CLOT|nr:hypothetical protein CLRAG_13440 [Clostridium ragsdalei P11]
MQFAEKKIKVLQGLHGLQLIQMIMQRNLKGNVLINILQLII